MWPREASDVSVVLVIFIFARPRPLERKNQVIPRKLIFPSTGTGQEDDSVTGARNEKDTGRNTQDENKLAATPTDGQRFKA